MIHPRRNQLVFECLPDHPPLVDVVLDLNEHEHHVVQGHPTEQPLVELDGPSFQIPFWISANKRHEGVDDPCKQIQGLLVLQICLRQVRPARKFVEALYLKEILSFQFLLLMSGSQRTRP